MLHIDLSCVLAFNTRHLLLRSRWLFREPLPRVPGGYLGRINSSSRSLLGIPGVVPTSVVVRINKLRES